MSTERIKLELPEKIQKVLNAQARYKVLYGGRGSAKSWSCARKALIQGCKRPTRFLCTRELQKSIRQSILKLLKDQIQELNLGMYYDSGANYLTGYNKTEFIFSGIRNNPEEIKSTEGIDVCLVEEGENLSEDSWDILDPTIRKENSEIWVIFNTRFKYDHLYQLFVDNEPPPDSVVSKVYYWDNPWFPEVLRRQMENMKETNYEKYLHIWEGELRKLAEGAVYGEQLMNAKRDGRILDFPITNAPVETFWDLGKNNHTAIWFMQKVGLEYRFIDYYESRMKEIPHYAKVVKGQAPLDEIKVPCMITEEANERRASYNYSVHHMPHDITTDVLGMTKTRKAQFEEKGVKPISRVSQIQNLETGIEYTRDIFPECYFHETNCERGLDALGNYRYKYNEEFDVYAKTPEHNWASNGADAFRQFPQSLKEAEPEHVDNRKTTQSTSHRDGRGRSRNNWMK